MLDKKGIAVLIALSKLLPKSGYKIIDKADIMSGLNNVEVTSDEIKVLLLDLVAKQYILKKYIDDEEYCIAITEMAIVKVKELELIELDKLTSSAVIKRNDAGEMVIAVNKQGESAVVQDKNVAAAKVDEVVTPHVAAEIVNTPRRKRRNKKNITDIDIATAGDNNHGKINVISSGKLAGIGVLSGLIGGAVGGAIVAAIYYIITTLLA